MVCEHGQARARRTLDRLSWPDGAAWFAPDEGQGARPPIPVERDPDRQRDALGRSFGASGLALEELWTRYLGVGGNARARELGSFLTGLTRLPSIERDLIAQALNENLDDLGLPRSAPYSCLY
jgi:hypothetical protein